MYYQISTCGHKLKILVECTILDSGEYWAWEMEGPKNDVEDLEESVREAIGIEADLIEIKITEIPNRLH